jgi:transposase-like protein
MPDGSALEFLAEVRSGNASFTAICRVFGITRQTGYKWLRRWREEHSVEEAVATPQLASGHHPAAVAFDRDNAQTMVSSGPCAALLCAARAPRCCARPGPT